MASNFAACFAERSLEPKSGASVGGRRAVGPMCALAALALAVTSSFGLVSGVEAAARVKSDPSLLAALRADAELRSCACIRAAVWLNLSYARVTVDAVRWKKLGSPGRARFDARALKVAEAAYLTEFSSVDQYKEIYVVDERGKLLSTYRP